MALGFSEKHPISSSEKLSIKYHNIFDYPLTKEELHKWRASLQNFKTNNLLLEYKNDFYFLKGREIIVKKRKQREKYSGKKLKIAKKAAKLLEKISLVKFIGITGALAMNNAGVHSDIDLMIITKCGKLWTTRLFVYLLLKITGYKLRSPHLKNEKDKLCINMWLDENDLIWNKKDRNIYTAHEIAQIVPLIDKKNTFEKFLSKNKWVLNYWPYATTIEYKGNNKDMENEYVSKIEQVAYYLQRFYMGSKITREIVTPKRAIFHPNDWGKIVISKLGENLQK